jgi:predicted O-methyltransferase YrrM
MIEIIRKAIEETGENGAWSRGEQFRKLMPHFLKYEGSIVEIGGGNGESTAIFLDAISDRRNVYVIDPWTADPSSTFTKGYSLNIFQRNVGAHDNLHLIQMDSHDSKLLDVIETIKPIAFAFVDGDQSTVENILADINLFANAGAKIICVDDKIRRKTAEDAIKIFDTSELGKKYTRADANPEMRCFCSYYVIN